MTEYEIRILERNGTIAAIITSQKQFDDEAAIRSAKTIARGRKFEVWRGLACIHDSSLVRYSH